MADTAMPGVSSSPPWLSVTRCNSPSDHWLLTGKCAGDRNAGASHNRNPASSTAPITSAVADQQGVAVRVGGGEPQTGVLVAADRAGLAVGQALAGRLQVVDQQAERRPGEARPGGDAAARPHQ